MPAAPGLTVRGLSVSYGRHLALEAMDLDVHHGERVGIVGPNGAGKSSILRAVVGLARHRVDRLLVDGRPVVRARSSIGYLPQRQNVDWGHPAQVRDVIAMGRYPHRGPVGRLSAHDHEVIEDALERVGMTPLARVRIGSLSGGQQQRMVLARLLAQQASVLLLDEPYSGLDAATIEVIDREITTAAQRGAAVLVVDHDLDGLAQRYDRLVVLRRHVIADGPVLQVLGSDALERAYGPEAALRLGQEGST